jgi:hypothetical protein
VGIGGGDLAEDNLSQPLVEVAIDGPVMHL